jgi:hypothetical protein
LRRVDLSLKKLDIKSNWFREGDEWHNTVEGRQTHSEEGWSCWISRRTPKKKGEGEDKSGE